MSYSLGIDTTFHTTGLALMNRGNNSVEFIKSVAIDFSDQDADKFFSIHIKNLVALFDLISDQDWRKIDLISVVNKEGAFHSLPIGVTAACILGYAKGKKVIGVDHEIAHLYSNWLERKNSQFKFPIVSLSVSGAHSTIYCLRGHKDIKKIAEVLWETNKDDFSGVAALFEVFCHWLKIKIPTVGMGGVVLSEFADKGKNLDLPELNKIRVLYKKDQIIISGCEESVQKIQENYKKDLGRKTFQRDLVLSFLNKIFEILSEALLKFAVSTKSKELHLVGGVSSNPIFQEVVEQIAIKNRLSFKAPAKNEFCGDNAAMVAARGKYKDIFTKTHRHLSVYPSFWYYRYYFRNYLDRK